MMRMLKPMTWFVDFFIAWLSINSCFFFSPLSVMIVLIKLIFFLNSWKILLMLYMFVNVSNRSTQNSKSIQVKCNAIFDMHYMVCWLMINWSILTFTYKCNNDDDIFFIPSFFSWKKWSIKSIESNVTKYFK